MILIILLTFTQGIIFFNVRKNKDESQPVVNKVEVEQVYIKDIDNYLSKLKNYNVINRSRDGESWIINVNIRGTKEELLSDLNLLDDFNIISYNIAFINNDGNMNLELKSR